MLYFRTWYVEVPADDLDAERKLYREAIAAYVLAGMPDAAS